MKINNLSVAIRELEIKYFDTKKRIEGEISWLLQQKDKVLHDIDDQRKGKIIVYTETVWMQSILDELKANLDILKVLLKQDKLNYLSITDKQTSIISNFNDEIDIVEKRIIKIKSQELRLEEIKKTYEEIKSDVQDKRKDLWEIIWSISSHNKNFSIRELELWYLKDQLTNTEKSLVAREKTINIRNEKLDRRESRLNNLEIKLFSKK